MKPYNFLIIGGGIVGLATARVILLRSPHSRVIVLEKEETPGFHQSSHNSGVMHCGLYYKPGSLKANLAVRGIRLMTEFCKEKGIRHEICGKVVVATDDLEELRLKQLYDNGVKNGLRNLRWLSAENLHEIEPYAVGQSALHVPEEGIVDYSEVCKSLLADIILKGGDFVAGAMVKVLNESASGWLVKTSKGIFESEFIINCAGLYCDRVAELCGVNRDARIVPFRGEYFKLTDDGAHFVNNLIYPVPSPEFPFLGVHFTRMIRGGVEAGPNAVLACSREGYEKMDINIRDLADTLFFRGFWKFISILKITY